MSGVTNILARIQGVVSNPGYGPLILLSSVAIAALSVAIAALMPPRLIDRKILRAAVGGVALILMVGILERLVADIGILSMTPVEAWDNTIQAIAGAWLHGEPLYPPAGDGTFYSLLYGPLLYEVIGAAQRIFGIGSPLAALPMVVAEVAATLVTWSTLRRMNVSEAAAAGAVGAMIAEYAVLHTVGSVRADQCLLLLAALALAALPALERGKNWPALGIGLSAGLCMALKFSGFAYAAPALLMVLFRPGSHRVALLCWALLGTVIGFALPYWFSGASLTEHAAFLAALRPMRVHPTLLIVNLVLTAALLGPAFVWCPSRCRSRDDVSRLIAVSVAILPIIVVAATDGTGRWHFLPFLPAMALVLGRALTVTPPTGIRHLVLLAGVSGMVVAGGLGEAGELRRIAEAEPAKAAVHATVMEFLADHAKEVVAIRSSSAETLDILPISAEVASLVSAGQPLLFSDYGWSDMRSAKNVEFLLNGMFSECRARYWLISKGNPFYAGAFIDGRVHDRFLKLYERTASLDGFDVWTCRKQAGSSP